MDEVRYLSAKRTVDDRSLNERVLDAFANRLQARTAEELRIVEFGAGTGTMPVRLLEWDMIPESVSYRAIEKEPGHVERARSQIPEQLSRLGFTVDHQSARDGQFEAVRGRQKIHISVEQDNAFDVTGNPDAIIACAFLDLVPLKDALSHIRDLLAPGGLLYAPITFDGFTGFAPTHSFDDLVTAKYHQHMAQRAGGPKSGRRLLELVSTYDGHIVSVGGSDWIIRPVDGTYPADERAVLGFLLSSLSTAVSELSLTPDQEEHFEHWVETREHQLDDESLTFIAHNLDILCQF